MTEKVWEVLKRKRERLAQLEAEEAVRQKERKVGDTGLKGLAVLIVALFMISGLAQAAIGVNWTMVGDHDDRSPGIRWSYTRMQRPSNHLGFGGPLDLDPTFSVLWDWQMNELWTMNGNNGNQDWWSGYALINAEVAGGDSSLWPTLRPGACLSWDGNVPGYWPDTGDVRPHLILAGGLNAQGYAMDEVNVFNFIDGFSDFRSLDGEWVAKLHLDVPVAYASCGRLTMRATWATNKMYDILGAVVMGGLTGTPLAATNAAQTIRTEYFYPPSSWFTNHDYVPSMGARFASAMVDKEQWGLHGENLDWFMWSGGATIDTWSSGQPIAATMVYPSTVHCYFEILFGWVTCEDYTNVGNVAPDSTMSASAYGIDSSLGKPMMMIYGGTGEFGFPRADLYTVKFDDAIDTATWTFWPSQNAPPARAGSVLYCSTEGWWECLLPFSAAPLPRYFVTGGKRWGSLNADTSEFWLPERHS